MPHCGARLERGDEYKPPVETSEKVFEFTAAFPVDHTRTGHRLADNQPLTLRVVDNNVRHLGGGVYLYTETHEVFDVEVLELVLGIPCVENDAALNKPGAELLDKGFDERILTAGRKRDLPAGRQPHWNARNVSRPL